MKVQWRGPHVARRVMLGYAWGPENDWVCEVAEDDAARVLQADALMVVVDDRGSEDQVSEAEAVSFAVGMGAELPGDGFEVKATEEEDDAVRR